MKKIFLLLLWVLPFSLVAQPVATPDKIYDELFTAVQLSQIFPDGKTFVDAIPKREPSKILADYKRIKSNPAIKFSLELFVNENFIIPQPPQVKDVQQEKDVVKHIENLWSVLKRNPDAPVAGSSLLPLPNPYIIPGGRFREIYYWDSYFTMLGLKESGETELIENMVKNFAYMINTYGHIPNGNRSYYVSRSQPPFFAMMVELLADIKGDEVLRTYLPALEKEYQYWMAGVDKIKPGTADRRVVKLTDGTVLNRYWDDLEIPRQESYREDVVVAENSVEQQLAGKTFKKDKDKEKAAEPIRNSIYRHLRSGAASGWDFSSRWFTDQKNIETIITTDLIAIDLNCLLYQLEKTIKLAYSKMSSSSPGVAAGYTAKAGEYDKKSKDRKAAIEKYCWNESAGIYSDYDFVRNKTGAQVNLAGMSALFFQVADRARADKQQQAVISKLLKDGGLLTTTENTGQQWDAPNGWAPLQWISIIGLEKYDYFNEARTVGERWVKLNKDVYARTGKLMEKYNVLDTKLEAGGGEYPSQDGFGWTNGVLLALIKKYNL
jgi:alpha,alpha-trehalase